MFCNICGSELQDGAGSCPICGAVFENAEEQTYVMHDEAPMYNRETIRSYGFYQSANPVDNRAMYTIAENGTEYTETKKNSFVSAGMVLAFIAAVLIFAGLFMPAINFAHFHEDVDLQYSLLKICKNVALISGMWRAIPVGFFIAAALMLILAFVRIPVFRILPCLLAIAMFVLMLADMGNIIEWANTTIEKFMKPGTIVLNFGEIMKSLMYGIYVIVAGLVVGVISCFTK